METPHFLTAKNLRLKDIIEKYPEYYHELFTSVNEDDIPLSERIWLYQNNLKEIPKCLNCDNKVPFINFNKGYRKYCSRKCSAIHTSKDIEVKNKRTEKMLLCNKDVDMRSSMTLKSNETKSKFTQDKKNIINEKRYETNLERYGVENVSSLDSVKEKIKEKLKTKLPLIKLEKTKNRITSLGFEILSITDKNFSLICPICKKSFDIHKTLFNNRHRFNVTICLNCNPNNKDSDFESNVYDFVKSTYDGDTHRQYKGFKKYEIDIFIPELNIGFECNGLWWHCEKYKETNYHIDKTNFFKEKGIRIIHIWEDDWKLKPNIIKSRIRNILNITENKIYARKCTISEISNKEAREFLDNNHIQGVSSTLKTNIGLLYNNEIVSIISFSKYRIALGRTTVENEYELIRFCSKLNTNVIGGFSKLLNNFIQKYNPSKIISYADKDWTDGNLYNKNGFTHTRDTSPNYFYFNKDQGIRLNRFGFRKDQLVKNGNPKNLTEHEIMNNLGYFRIYNTGTMLYEKILNENL